MSALLPVWLVWLLCRRPKNFGVARSGVPRMPNFVFHDHARIMAWGADASNEELSALCLSKPLRRDHPVVGASRLLGLVGRPAGGVVNQLRRIAQAKLLTDVRAVGVHGLDA